MSYSYGELFNKSALKHWSQDIKNIMAFSRFLTTGAKMNTWLHKENGQKILEI